MTRRLVPEHVHRLFVGCCIGRLSWGGVRSVGAGDGVLFHPAAKLEKHGQWVLVFELAGGLRLDAVPKRFRFDDELIVFDPYLWKGFRENRQVVHGVCVLEMMT